MIDLSSLQTKVNDLKAKVAINSITPYYLGALLDDFISQMKSLDLSDDLDAALDSMRTSISGVARSAKDAGDAAAAVRSALDSAISDFEAAIKAISDSEGKPGGLATLDSSGRLKSDQVPDYLNNGLRGGATARFSAIVEENVDTQAQGTGTGLEMGGEATAGTVTPGGGGTVTTLATVVYLRKKKVFALKDNGRYYVPWESKLHPMWMYNESATHVLSNKLFLCGGKAYVWDEKAADLREVAGDKADAGMFVTLGESEYAALATKDDDTYYFIYEDE